MVLSGIAIQTRPFFFFVRFNLSDSLDSVDASEELKALTVDLVRSDINK